MSVNKTPSTSHMQDFGAQVVNLTKRERFISVAVGTFLIVRALKKKSLLRSMIGGYLIYRGASGHCTVTQQLQRSKYTDRAESVNIQTTFIVNKPRAEVYDF